MRFSVALAFLASAGFAVAQTTTATTPSATSGSCAAQNIVDACKKTIQGQIDSCGPNDWVCLCDQWTNMLTCYNNCPNSQDRPPVQNTVTSYCNAAAPLKSSSSAAAATASKPAETSLATSATPTAAQNTASGTPSASGSAKTGAAVANVVPAFGGVFAVALGVAGLL